MNSSTLLTKLWTLLLVNLSNLIMDYIKSSLWNEFVLFMDFINPSTLIMDSSTCGPNHELIHLWDELVLFINLWIRILVDFMIILTHLYGPGLSTYGLNNTNLPSWDELVHFKDPSTLWTSSNSSSQNELVQLKDLLINSFTLWKIIHPLGMSSSNLWTY